MSKPNPDWILELKRLGALVEKYRLMAHTEKGRRIELQKKLRKKR